MIGKPGKTAPKFVRRTALHLDDAPVAQGGIPQATLAAAAPAVTVMQTPQQPLNADAALVTCLRKLIACSYTMYLSAHAAHWNVEGAVFPSWHEFFGALYEDVFSPIDALAEAIRQHAGFAPTSFAEVLSASVATESPFQPGAPKESMVAALIAQNAALMGCLKECRTAAEAALDEGLANFLQERMAAHLKHDWMLKSLIK